MNILILDKDGVLTPEAFKPAVKWGMRNLSPVIMTKMLFNYLVLKKVEDKDMEKLETFFSSNIGNFVPSESTIAAVLRLRKEYDKIILLTNNGTGDVARTRIMDEINQYYPQGTFDKIIIQRVGASKEEIYKKYANDGNKVTVIDDSPRHIKAAIQVGIQKVIAITNKKAPENAIVFNSLQEYVASRG